MEERREKLTMEKITEELFNYGFFGKKAALENITKILKELGNPEKTYKIIHIAGTNGKGSVATTLETILQEAGYLVGKFTSPHILKVNERINFKGTAISDLEFIEQYKIIKKITEKLDLIPTFFEFMTALMFNYFKEKKIDYLVLEVGLGGRLDSTNVADGDIAVITNVSLDHLSQLGNTLEKIAFEKCGIIKSHSKVIIGESKNRNIAILKEILKEKKFEKVIFTKEKYKNSSSYNLDFENFITEVKIENDKYRFSLFGEHQYENFLTAYEVGKELGVSDEIIKKACQKVYWECRFEVFKKNGKIIVLDGAHNIDGVQHLKNSLLKFYSAYEILSIVSVLEDKEIKPMLEEIDSFSGELVLTSLAHIKRGVSGKEIEKKVRGALKTKITVIEDILESYLYGIKSDKKVVVICGSFYLLGKIKEVLKNDGENKIK